MPDTAQPDPPLPDRDKGDNASAFRAEGERTIRLSRRIAARPDRVRAAHVDAGLLPLWRSTDDTPLTEARIDARVGGGFFLVWRMRDGSEMTLNGQFTRLDPDAIEQVELFFPDWTNGETHVRTEFHDEGGGTLLSMAIHYVDGPTRDGVMHSGYGPGLETALDRLAALLDRE